MWAQRKPYSDLSLCQILSTWSLDVKVPLIIHPYSNAGSELTVGLILTFMLILPSSLAISSQSVASLRETDIVVVSPWPSIELL